MKKLLSITFSAVLIVSVAATAFVSCKKETKGIVYNTYQISEKTEAQLVYENIVKFREARKAYHSNAKAENGYVSPSEARSILDGAINYEFSNMNRYLKDTKIDTLRYTAPTTNAEGNVSVNDLIDIYDMFVNLVAESRKMTVPAVDAIAQGRGCSRAGPCLDRCRRPGDWAGGCHRHAGRCRRLCRRPGRLSFL